MKLFFERGAWASKKARKIISTLKPSEVRKILIIRHAALGDMVLVRPFLVEARKFFPQAEIMISIVSNYSYGVPYDLVDRVHIFSGNDQKTSLLEKIRQARRAGKTDILFDLADTSRSRILTLFCKAKLKVGFPYRNFLRVALFDVAVWRSDFTFEATNMLHALMIFGANPSQLLDYGWREKPQISSSKIVYFPFASTVEKTWPLAKYQKLIEESADDLPEYTHVILGGINYQEGLTDFSSICSKKNNIKLHGASSLEDTVSLLRSASLVVSNDTGIRNLAISLSIPTIGIFFSTVPYRYWSMDPVHYIIFNSEKLQPEVFEVKRAIMAALGA